MKYVKKPVIVEVYQWNKFGDITDEEIDIQPINVEWKCPICGKDSDKHAKINTLEGWKIICPGDYIVVQGKGEYLHRNKKNLTDQYDEYVEPKEVQGELKVKKSK